MPQVFGCRKKMSAIAVLNPSGAEALYSRMHTLAAEGRQDHARLNGEVSADPLLLSVLRLMRSSQGMVPAWSQASACLYRPLHDQLPERLAPRPVAWPASNGTSTQPDGCHTLLDSGLYQVCQHRPLCRRRLVELAPAPQGRCWTPALRAQKLPHQHLHPPSCSG